MIRKNIINKKLIFIFLVLILSLNILSIAQEDQMGFSLDPLLFKKNTLPGKTLNYEINIDNKNNYKRN